MENIQELRQRYTKFYDSDGIDEHTLNEIEDTLNVKLPDDFRKIATFYTGGLLGGISIFAVTNKNISPNIVGETLRLRDAVDLPLRYVVLAEPPASLIVMDTENTHSILWCDATDVVRLNDRSFISSPQTWGSFSEFFTTLLEDEEEEQQE
jgi:hypothetical protein